MSEPGFPAEYFAAAFAYGAWCTQILHSAKAAFCDWRARRQLRGQVASIRAIPVASVESRIRFEPHRLRYRMSPMGYKYGDLDDRPYAPPVLAPAAVVHKRDAVLKDVAVRQDGWMQLAMAAFHKLPAEWSGLGENIRFDLTALGLPAPRTPQTWGVFIGILIKRGLLVPTGERRPMTAEGSNGRRSDCYRRPLAMEGAA